MMCPHHYTPCFKKSMYQIHISYWKNTHLIIHVQFFKKYQQTVAWLILKRDAKCFERSAKRKVLQQGKSFQLSWANGGSGGKFKIYIWGLLILKVRNPLLCTVLRGPLYVKGHSPGSWDWPTWLNKPWNCLRIHKLRFETSERRAVWIRISRAGGAEGTLLM